MFILYDVIFLIVAVFFLPVYALRRKFHSGLFFRLGFLPRDFLFERPIWIHAVSVGEALAVKALIAELRKVYPYKKILISTVTATGNKIAKDIAAGNALVIYLPFDFSFSVKRVIDRVKPEVFIIAETEIWPNLISYLYKKSIPVIIVNGRISDVSFRNYCLIKPLFEAVLRKVTLFCVQTQRDEKRLMHLGVRQERIHITGNMKYDRLIQPVALATAYREKLSLAQESTLLIAGSTHPQEEDIIVGVYKELVREFPMLRLLIAPRHPERSKEILELVSKYGLRGVLLSSAEPECGHCLSAPVYILDFVGELVNFYSIADIVFVGGSLVPKGGQNILEPASLGKPVLFGPHTFNFRDITELFLSNDAAIRVHNAEGLREGIAILLRNAKRAKELGLAARALVCKNQGATKKTAELIKLHYHA